MKDRRSWRRHATESVEVVSPTFQGQILNLSLDGLAIETTTAIRPGREVSLKIDGEGVTVTGHVRWSRLQSLRRGEGGDPEPIYHAGIAILESDREESDDSR